MRGKIRAPRHTYEREGVRDFGQYAGMKVTRIYTGDDDRSHFEELDVPMAAGTVGRLSELVPSEGIFFREPEGSGAADFIDFHRAPRRQFVIHLAGCVEIEIGDGETRRFGVGDILLADDTTGQGHISRGIEGPRAQVFITVPSDLDLAPWR
jgi:hypothetical protein